MSRLIFLSAIFASGLSVGLIVYALSKVFFDWLWYVMGWED